MEKTLNNQSVTETEIRNAYKIFHQKEYTALERDSVLKLLTRKTLFNNQHKKVFPGVRPDWAKEDFCWECNEETGEQVQEDLLHCLWTCRAKYGVRQSVLNNLKLEPAMHPSTTLLWGNSYTFRRTAAKSANISGNFVNWMTTLQFLKCRNVKRVNSAAITSIIQGKLIWLRKVFFRSNLVKESIQCLDPLQLTRPPEDLH